MQGGPRLQDSLLPGHLVVPWTQVPGWGGCQVEPPSHKTSPPGEFKGEDPIWLLDPRARSPERVPGLR